MDKDIMIMGIKYGTKFIVVVLLFLCLTGQAQNRSAEVDSLKKLEKQRRKEIDSFKKIDFLSKDYKYLDSDYNIKIDSAAFNSMLKMYGFYPERIIKYSDSLSVILRHELQSWHGARIASSKITMSWKKIGYYLWENEMSAEAIGNAFGFKHPYRFLEYLFDDTKSSDAKSELFDALKTKIKATTDKSLDTKPYKAFLREAFALNPKRIADMDAYIKKRRGKAHKH